MEAVITAATLLKSRFLRSDKYNDRKAPRYWFKFQYPFWWTNLLTSLDTLPLLDFGPEDRDVGKALQWFVDNQQQDGLWATSYKQSKRAQPSARERKAMQWVSLAICRVFQRFTALRPRGQQEPTDS